MARWYALASRKNRNVEADKPIDNATTTAAIAPTASLLRRTIFLNRYSVLGGRAKTGSSFRCRTMSIDSPLAVSYRSVRSFSIALRTIQSRSPLISCFSE